MAEIKTQRLKLVPMNLELLELFLKNMEFGEAALGLEFSGEPLEQGLRETMESLYEETQRETQHILWYTAWVILFKNQIAGFLCLMGKPDMNSEVELGYLLRTAYRGKGYMTEALGALCQFVLGNSGIRSIRARTDSVNHASIKVLEKCGFEKVIEDGNEKIWRLKYIDQ